MSTFLFCTIVVLIAISPALVGLWRAHRERRLAEARLGISVAITKLNQMIIDDHVGENDLCRNEVYKLMLIAQARQNYSVRIFVPSVNVQKSDLFRNQLLSELESGKPELTEAVHLFTRSYYRATCFRHPVKVSIVVFELVARLLLASATWVSFMAAFRSLRMLQNTWNAFRRAIQREVVVMSYNDVVNCGYQDTDPLLADLRRA